MKKSILILTIMVVLCLSACGGGNQEGLSSKDSSQDRSRDCIDALKSIDYSEITHGETITDIAIENRTVIISVDMSTADTGSFDARDIAESDYSSITDAALEIVDFDDLWDSMIVDFGDLGSITKTKEDIKDEGYGRFFDYGSDIGWD